MTGYRVGLVRVKNFGPFASAEYDLSRPGLTVIEGEYVGHGCDSNGSGKSALLDAPTWCLYGRTLRERVSKDDVVRLLFRNVGGGTLEAQRDERGALARPDAGCSVEVHLVNGPRPVKVTRYQGHPLLGNRVELYVSGTPVTQGRDAMTQAAIEQEIGLDYRTFVNSVAFGAGADVRSFFAATDAERKAIMDRLLSLEVYADAERFARSKAKIVQGGLDVAVRRREALKATLISQARMRRELMSADEVQAKSDRLATATRHLASLTKRAALLRGRLRESKQKLKLRRREATRVERAYQRACALFERKVSSLERRIIAAERDIASERAEARAATGSAGRTSTLVGLPCPTCKQTVSRKFARAVAAQAEQMCAEHVATAERIERETLQPLRTELARTVEPERPRLDAYEKARSRWEVRRSAYRANGARVEAAQEAKAEFEREVGEAQARADKIKAEIASTKRGLRELRDATKGLRSELAKLEFWVEGFGNAGIKSFLIEAEVPVINRVATQYAQRLLGPGASVRLSATRDLKGGGQREELVVHAVIPGCTVSYATASKGQKKRLDLCILLAFRDVVSRRSVKAFEQFFADELFDGLDETGEEFVIELLRDLSAKCPVTLVTHSPRLKSASDQVITVRHENGVAIVETARARVRA